MRMELPTLRYVSKHDVRLVPTTILIGVARHTLRSTAWQRLFKRRPWPPRPHLHPLQLRQLHPLCSSTKKNPSPWYVLLTGAACPVAALRLAHHASLLGLVPW